MKLKQIVKISSLPMDLDWSLHTRSSLRIFNHRFVILMEKHKCQIIPAIVHVMGIFITLQAILLRHAFHWDL